MTSAFGNYDESYPPEVLRGYEAPALVGAARRSTSAETVTRTFTVSAGEPGEYEPEVAATDRPRNVTELRERAKVTDPTPWPAGAYVLVGTSGKRAHWDGDDWHGGESPGYTVLEPAEPGEPGESGTVESDPDSPIPGVSGVVETADGARHVGEVPASAALDVEDDDE